MVNTVDAVEIVADGIVLSVRLTPKASRNEIDGWAVGADGKVHLKVRVTAVPEKGKANKALIKLLSKSLGLAPTLIDVVAGETNRNKRLKIEGAATQLAEHLLEQIPLSP